MGEIGGTDTSGRYRDYTVGGPEAKKAQDKGLAEANWHCCSIERKTLRRLMQRDDYHALRDTFITFSLIGASGYAAYHFWYQESYGLFALFFWIYCTIYCSTGDSRWHECGHST